VDWTQRLNAALDYLEETWDREPDLARAAGLANCSPFHFLRMFEVVSGLSPGEYSRRRRLSRAALDLAATDDRVIDVALRYGYETPEAFAKAFKRLFGITPSEARVPGTVLETWPPLRLAVVLKGDRAMKYRIVEKPAFRVTGWALATTSEGGANMREIPRFWDTCHAEGKVAALAPHTMPWGMLGICCDMDMKAGTFHYVIGVEDHGTPLPEGTRTFPVPAATYAVFESVGAMPDAIQNVWKEAYGQWFPSSGYEHGGTPDFEVYPAFPPGDERGDPSSPKCYSEVWIPLKSSRS
jgi:AraC family transcriptional regulator